MHANLGNGWITWLSAKQKHFECHGAEQMRDDDVDAEDVETVHSHINAHYSLVLNILKRINVFWFSLLCIWVIKCELRPFARRTLQVNQAPTASIQSNSGVTRIYCSTIQLILWHSFFHYMVPWNFLIPTHVDSLQTTTVDLHINEEINKFRIHSTKWPAYVSREISFRFN